MIWDFFKLLNCSNPSKYTHTCTHIHHISKLVSEIFMNVDFVLVVVGDLTGDLFAIYLVSG